MGLVITVQPNTVAKYIWQGIIPCHIFKIFSKKKG